MGCSHNLIFGHHTYHHFAISLLILVISTTSQLRLFNAQGRRLDQTPNENSKVVEVKEDKTMWMGSRPPRCKQSCESCAPCEAIQVPTDPQTRNHRTPPVSAIDARGTADDRSNYKPMSWKCKCGNLIHNP